MTQQSFSPEIIEESAMTSELDAAIRACLCACFPADVQFFSKSRPWHDSYPEYSVICRETDAGIGNDAIIGHVGIVVRDIKAGTEIVRIAGIQNMAVRPEYRGTGLGDVLLNAAMQEAKNRCIPVSVLFCIPELERYYNRFGWVHHNVKAFMDFNGETDIPIPGKNICMIKPLANAAFPNGDLHLQGPDW